MADQVQAVGSFDNGRYVYRTTTPLTIGGVTQVWEGWGVTPADAVAALRREIAEARAAAEFTETVTVEL